MALSRLVGINLFGPVEPHDGVRRIARAGYSAIDYSAIGRQVRPGDALAVELRRCSADLGLAPAALHYRSFGFAFLAEPEARRRFQETAVEDVRLAAVLGAPAIAFHLGNDLPGADDATLADANADAMAPAAAAAAELGVNLALENHCHGWGDRLAHLELVAARLDSPAVGFCLDSGHAAAAGLDPAALARTMGGRLRLVHLHSNDGRRDIHRPAGQGVVRWPPLLAALHAVGYRGALLLEGGLHMPGEDVDAILPAHLAGFRRELARFQAGDRPA